MRISLCLYSVLYLKIDEETDSTEHVHAHRFEGTYVLRGIYEWEKPGNKYAVKVGVGGAGSASPSSVQSSPVSVSS